jgi:hypothetical protein
VKPWPLLLLILVACGDPALEYTPVASQEPPGASEEPVVVTSEPTLTPTATRQATPTPISGGPVVEVTPFGNCQAFVVCADCAYYADRGLTEPVDVFEEGRIVTVLRIIPLRGLPVCELEEGWIGCDALGPTDLDPACFGGS